MDEQTLEPCPFCGNDEPVLEKVSALSRLSAVFCNACEISGEKMSTPEAAIAAWNHRAAHSVIAGKVAELEDWAFEQSRLHHQLAVENEPLRTEHIASSTAYRELGLKLREQAALAPYPERRHD